jgi:hypothetical protein
MVSVDASLPRHIETSIDLDKLWGSRGVGKGTKDYKISKKRVPSVERE